MSTEDWANLFLRAGWDGIAASAFASSSDACSDALAVGLPLMPAGVRRPGTLVDVGANRGAWARAARRFFPDATIHCVEADPALASQLSQTFDDDPRTHVHAVAAGAARGTVKFNRYSYSELSSTRPLQDQFEKTWNVNILDKVMVDICPLDALLPGDITQPVWLKIDVQGGEQEVFEGAVALLNKVELLMVEVAFTSVYYGDVDFWAVNRHLTTHCGLTLYNLGNLHREPGPELVWGDAIYVRPECFGTESPIGGDVFAPSLRLTNI